MNPTVKRKWLRALRSGKYRKGRGQLRTGNKFCCLGVLCDLYAVEHKKKWERGHGGSYAFMGEREFPPEAVMAWAGFESGDPRIRSELTAYNDGRGFPRVKRHSFRQIATIIEQWWP